MLKWLLSLFTAVCLSFVPAMVQAEGVSKGKTVWDSVNDSKKSDETINQEKNQVTDSSEGGSTFFMLVKLIFMLGVVLAILYFVLRFIQKKSVSFQDGRNLQSLGGIGIGQNRSVQLIKTGNSVLVVGVGDTVTLLKEITDEAEVKSMLEQRPAQNMNTVASQWKEKWFKSQGDKQEGNTSSSDQSVNFKNVLDSLMSERKEQRKEIQKAFEEGKHHE